MRRALVALPVSVAILAPSVSNAADLPPLGEDRAQALQCLTLAVAYEAGNQSADGQRAVAEVVLNRMRDPAFPKTVCGVVFAGSTRRTGCQFTFTCDGSLRRLLSPRTMASARSVAEEALSGGSRPLVSGATHYHADYVRPFWAPRLLRMAQIGAHIFYRGRQTSFGTPGAAVSAVAAAVATRAPTTQATLPFTPWGLALPAGEGAH